MNTNRMLSLGAALDLMVAAPAATQQDHHVDAPAHDGPCARPCAGTPAVA